MANVSIVITNNEDKPIVLSVRENRLSADTLHFLYPGASINTVLNSSLYFGVSEQAIVVENANG